MKDKDFDKLWNSGATAREYRQCPISDHELETIIGNAIERDSKTRKKHFPVWQKPYVYLAMVAACMAAVVVGLWQVGGNLMFVAPASDALQSSTSLLATQTTDMPTTPILQHTDSKPATITDNEIKNTADHTTNKHNHTRYAENKTATSQPDIIATAPIEQEHIPMLLAETETQIEIEQNLAADTAYMIADAGEVYDVLEMYCSTDCSNKYIIDFFDECVFS